MGNVFLNLIKNERRCPHFKCQEVKQLSRVKSIVKNARIKVFDSSLTKINMPIRTFSVLENNDVMVDIQLVMESKHNV